VAYPLDYKVGHQSEETSPRLVQLDRPIFRGTKTRAQAFDWILRWIDFEKMQGITRKVIAVRRSVSERGNGRSPIGLERMLVIQFIQYYAQF
jgi:hypothetical protein